MSQLQVTGEAKIRDIQGPVVANDGVVTALDGAASQYVRGDGTLADFPTSSGGGSSVSYYLNSSVSQGTIGGVAYRELSKDPIIGTGTDIAIAANGYVANYITDVNDPDVVLVPGGNFNCEFYFSVSNDTGNPNTYAELYKYDGTTFTLLGTSAGVPESINQGTTIAPYYFAIPVATASLALTDRLAIRIYVNVDGRTVTLHTENGHLCQVVTTLSKGMVSLNNLTDQSQFLTTGTSGTDFNIVSSGDTHTFNIPSASATNRGLITTGSQTISGSKTFSSAITADSGITLKEGVIPSAVGYTGLAGDADGLLITKRVSSTAYTNLLYFNSATSNTYTFPNATGTLALTSNLSSYVPYTGATANVDLGINSILAFGFSAEGSGAVSGSISLKQNGSLFAGSGYATIGSTAVNKLNLYFGDASLRSVILDNSLLSANRTYNFPDLSGTLALLEGSQTFSGSKTFSALTAFTFANGTRMDYGLYLSKGAVPSAFTSLTTNIYSDATTNNIVIRDNSSIAKLDFNNSTQTYTFPAASGTIALTSDLSGYVTLATTQTISGAKTFSLDILVNNVKIGNANGSNLNTVVGFGALTGTGVENTAVGYLTLSNNTTGNSNTAVGKRALINNTTASWNTAIGSESLFANTTGVANVAIGYYSLFANTTGFSNVSVGYNSMSTSNGNENTAIGNQSMQLNTTGVSNTAIGHTALQSNTTGNNNIAIGYESGINITTGSNNTIIGKYAGTTTLANNIVLADGAGNIRYQWNGTNNVFGNPISGTSATFSSTLSAGAATFSSSIAATTGTFSTSATTVLSMISTGTASGLQLNNTGGTNSNWIIQSDGGAVAGQAALRFYSITASAYRMSIDGNGNVGIGTSSPDGNSKLDVNGQAFVAHLAIYNNNGTPSLGTSPMLYSPASATLAISTNDTERMRIDAAGNLYFGCTSDPNASTNGIALFSNGEIDISRSNGTSGVFNRNTSNGQIIDFRYNNTVVGSISTNSNSLPSDLNFKKDITDISIGLNLVTKLRPVHYRHKMDEDNEPLSNGIIAQELEQSLLECGIENNSLLMLQHKPNEKEGESQYWVDYTKMIPVLIKSIQEQQAQIEELKQLILNK